MPHIDHKSALHPHAQAAIRAAQNLHIWGRYATLQYLRKRSVPMYLFSTARVLEAAHHMEHHHVAN